MNRFGPINGIYGRRRLNVLFTRAKDRVGLFTSMRPGDIRERMGVLSQAFTRSRQTLPHLVD